MTPRFAAGGVDKRCKTLKTLLSGAGIVAGGKALPERCLKPVVSTIVMPVPAQTSPASGPAFECSIVVADVVLIQPEVYSYAFQITSEAAVFTPVRFTLRDPGTAEFNAEGDVIDDGTMFGGSASVEGNFSAEFEGSTLLDVDIDIDGEIDCSQGATL